MSIVLGRWPLIPEQCYTVALPQRMMGPSRLPDDNGPDIFYERRLQIGLAQIASSILFQSDGKPCTEPATIDKQMEILNKDLIQELPSAFRLDNPEEKWDEQMPHFGRQSQMFKISVLATKCMLLRPMIIIPAKEVRAMSASDQMLVAKHRMSLIDVAIQMFDSVLSLHSLMGGKQHWFFLLSFFTLEPAVLLGIYLITPRVGARKRRQGSSALKSSRGTAADEHDKWKQGLQRMKEAVARLRMLSEVSSIARTGFKVLEKMLVMVTSTDMARSIKGDETMSVSSSSKSRPPNSNANNSHTSSRSQPSNFLPNLTGNSSVSSIPGERNAHEAFSNPNTSSFPYEYIQIQDSASLVNNCQHYEIEDQYNVCDIDLHDGDMTNDLSFLNGAADMSWSSFTARTAAADASLMEANDYAPDMAIEQDFDWSWIGSHDQQTAWFGV